MGKKMGVGIHGGTMDGAVTPMCNKCGIALCWDISEEEYGEAKKFWDKWICQECNDGQPLSLKEWMRFKAREITNMSGGSNNSTERIVNCNSFQVEIAREYFTSGNYPKHSTKEMDEAITAIDECNKSHYGDECDICRVRS